MLTYTECVDYGFEQGFTLEVSIACAPYPSYSLGISFAADDIDALTSFPTQAAIQKMREQLFASYYAVCPAPDLGANVVYIDG